MTKTHPHQSKTNPRFRPTPRRLLPTLVASLVASFAYADPNPQAELDQLIAEIQAKGEPILFEDLAQPPIPDADNKAFYIRQAFAEHWPKVPDLGTTILQTDWYKQGGMDPLAAPSMPNPITDNAAYLAQCQPLIETVLKASQAKQTQWPHQHVKFELIATPLPELSEARFLTKLLQDASHRHLEQNNPKQALRCILAMLEVEASIDLEKDLVAIQRLVAMSIRVIAMATLEDCLPLLGPSEKDQIQAILHALANETTSKQNHARALMVERVHTMDLMQSLIDDPSRLDKHFDLDHRFYLPNNPISRKDWEARLMKDAIWYLQAMATLHDIFQGNDSFPTYQQAREATDDLSSEALDKVFNDPANHFLSALSIPTFPEAFPSAHYKMLTGQRLAKVALALKLYQLDHGLYPQTLDALVPDYLPAIHIDPTDPKGRPIGYLPNGCTLYRSSAYSQGKSRKAPPLLTSPDPAQALPIQGPPVLHSIGPSGVERGCPIEVTSDGEVKARDKFSNDYAFTWFALEPWPSVEPTHEDLEDTQASPFMNTLESFGFQQAEDEDQ